MPIATSTVKLWKNIVLSPDKNYVIDDLEDYLGTPDTTISNFQFVELKKEITIKIVLAQYNLQFDSTYNFNYCHISRNQGESFSANDGAYYFVKSMKWKSTEAVELELEMDVLNSFEWDESYKVTDKTMVKREHKNRFSSATSFGYMSEEFDLQANTPKTFSISTPLMASARIKSVSNITLSGASITPIYTPETISSIYPTTEYFFATNTSCPSPASTIETLNSNNIVFKRYNVLTGELLEKTNVGRVIINPNDNSLTVYKHVRNGIFDVYKTVDWTLYPVNSGSNSGIWTITPQSPVAGHNVPVFNTGLGGTVTQSIDIQKTVNENSVEVTITSANNLTGLKFFFSYKIYAYIANIDLKSEGINPPLYRTLQEDFSEPSGVSWSLLYKNSGTPSDSPVDCYLYPSENLTVEVPSTANTLTKDNVPSNEYAVICAVYNSPVPTFSFVDDNNNNRTFTPGYRTSVSDEYIDVIAFKATNTGVEVWAITAAYSPYVGEWWGNWTKMASNASVVNVTGALNELKYYPTSSLPNANWIAQHHRESVYATGTISMSALIQATLHNKDIIDRTDEKNIKLITLPYAPTPVVVDHSTSKITVGSEWYFNLTDGTLKLNDLNSKFKNKIESNQPLLVSDLLYNTYQATWDGTGLRGISDPKLLHSDYYYKKFVYDSFNKIFRLETLDWSESIKNPETHFTFDFITSRNIVSKFLFMFPQYTTGNKGIEDYDNMLAVARNNEEVLFNSQYLNYLRTGYNYDLKTKERNEVAGGVGIGLSAAALAASAALAFIPGIGPALSAAGVMGVIGSGIGLVNSSVNYAKTTAQAEENIQRKLQEAQNQAVSVLNADDFDLLEAYSGNVAKMCTYEVSAQMRSALNDMFHYAGYIVNEQYKPEIDTRYWFNFLQAELVIDTWDNVAVDIQEQLKQKFNEGVTFFHCHTINSVKTWDIAQEKENLEKWIVIENGGAQ